MLALLFSNCYNCQATPRVAPSGTGWLTWWITTSHNKPCFGTIQSFHRAACASFSMYLYTDTHICIYNTLMYIFICVCIYKIGSLGSWAAGVWDLPSPQLLLLCSCRKPPKSQFSLVFPQFFLFAPQSLITLHPWADSAPIFLPPIFLKIPGGFSQHLKAPKSRGPGAEFPPSTIRN